MGDTSYHARKLNPSGEYELDTPTAMPGRPYSDEDYKAAKEQGLNLDDWGDYEKYFSLGEEEDYS